MTLPGTFQIYGSLYTRKELEAHSRELAQDPAFPDWERKVFSFIRDFLDESVMLEQRSSGTTGDPKVFVLRREAMLKSARLTLDTFSLEPGDQVLLALPVDFIAGKMMIVRALLGQLDLVLTVPSSRPLEGVEGAFSLVSMVPLQVHRSMEAGDELARCGILLVGGGDLDPGMRDSLSFLSRPEVYASFGMSETYTHFALQRINGPAPDKAFRCLPGVGISIDERNCLEVDFPGITMDPVQTNDLVEILPDGQSFRWLGRFDNVINSGGIKIIPEILEERISSILGLPVLLLPRPHESLGQQLVLLAECIPGEFRPELWKQKLEPELASHELPREYHHTPAFTRNASMKPDRLAMGQGLRSGS